MNRRNSLTFYFLSAFFLVISGCDSTTSPPAFQDTGSGGPIGVPACKSVVSGTFVSEIREELENVRRESESHLHELSDQFPGFGGIFLDETGRYNIFLTDLTAESEVRSLLTDQLVTKMRSDDQIRDVIIHRAEYRFRDLAVWRELATAFLLSGNRFP
jgi:hypothetical protein